MQLDNTPHSTTKNPYCSINIIKNTKQCKIKLHLNIVTSTEKGISSKSLTHHNINQGDVNDIHKMLVYLIMVSLEIIYRQYTVLV